MIVERLAPAKVNLFLHVGPPADDGYHPLSSLVTFADVGDVVVLEDAERFGFDIEGPFAGELADEDGNLVVRARDRLVETFAPRWSPFRLKLRKNLPIAAGLGGGSADAAAALQLMAARAGLSSQAIDRRLFKISAQLGADVPMCLVGEPRLALGRGDELGPAPSFPNLEAVLVNPLKPSPTGAVYRAYDAAGSRGGADTPAWPGRLASPEQVAVFLAARRNDLEAPAISLQPAIAEVLADLRARSETLLARMSGSGATCFALCRSRADRDHLAAAVATSHPDWWVQACRLRGAS